MYGTLADADAAAPAALLRADEGEEEVVVVKVVVGPVDGLVGSRDPEEEEEGSCGWV